MSVILHQQSKVYIMTECRVDGCQKDIDRKGYCGLHYMRQWKNGTTDIIRRPAKERLEHSHGYWVLNKKDHALSDKGGYVYEHRYVYYESFGGGPFNCYLCHKEVNWSNLHIDHLNDNKKDNRIENLSASCARCNQQRGNDKKIQTWRKNTGLEYGGKIYGMQELADLAKISRQSLMIRLKKMSVKDAVEKPRGKYGPRSKTHG